jgi:hypothetical protein
MNIKDIGFGDVDWNYPAKDKVQRRVTLNTTIELGVALNAGNLLTN